jgi:hypothetical protein
MELTTAASFYGAALSTIVFLWNAAMGRARINVAITYAADTKEGVTRGGIMVSIQNPSFHPAHITSVSIVHPYRTPSLRERIEHMVRFRRLPLRVGWVHGGLSLYGVETQCPVSIEARKAHLIFVPDEALQLALSDANRPYFRVVVQDALWRNKYSKKFNYQQRGR